MITELKSESRIERTCLTETELDGVVAGTMSDYTNMMQTLSSCLRMMADLQKSITGNIR